MKNHKSLLTARKTKLLANKCIDPSMVGQVADFCAKVSTVSEIHPMEALLVVNYDKTRVFLTSEGSVCLEHARKARSQKANMKGVNLGTLLSFISANGLVLLSVWIFKGTSNATEKKNELSNDFSALSINFLLKDEHKYNLRSSYPTMYAVTETGYSNTILHMSIIEYFGKIWRNTHSLQHCWLFGDQLASHKNVDMVRKALEDNVMCWFFPANTLHFLQPLDATAFARFKQEINMECIVALIKPNMTSQEHQMLMYNIAYNAETKAFTKRVIMRSFNETGVFPWQPDIILQLAKQNAALATTKVGTKDIQAMRRSVEAKLQPKKKEKTVKRGKARVLANCVYTPFELIAHADQQAEEYCQGQQKKRKAAEDKTAEKAAKKAAHTCSDNSCSTYTRELGGAKGWHQCTSCKILYCKKHTAQYNAHVTVCTCNNTNGVTNNIVQL